MVDIEDGVAEETEVEVEEPEVEAPEVEEPKPEKVKKPKKVKKAKPEPEPVVEVSPGEVWWDKVGQVLVRKGHSSRNVVLKASQASGAGFNRAMAALGGSGTLKEKAISLFS